MTHMNVDEERVYKDLVRNKSITFTHKEFDCQITYTYNNGIILDNITNPCQHPKDGENTFFDKINSNSWVQK